MEFSGPESLLLLGLRLIIAGALIDHAYRSVRVDECGEPVIREMGDNGRWARPLTLFTEGGAAVLLGLGLFTPVGAALLLAIAIGTNVTMHGRTGPWLGFPRWECLIAILALGGLALAHAGPGEYALDYQFDAVDDLYRGTGLLIAILLGVVAEAMFLGLGWYPSAARTTPHSAGWPSLCRGDRRAVVRADRR